MSVDLEDAASRDVLPFSLVLGNHYSVMPQNTELLTYNLRYLPQ
jgi:hypothetical protein